MYASNTTDSAGFYGPHSKAQSLTQSWQPSFCVIWVGAVFPVWNRLHPETKETSHILCFLFCGRGCKNKNLEKISEHTSNPWNLQTLSWRGKFLNLHHLPKACGTLAHLAVLLGQHDVIYVMNHCDIPQDVQTVSISSYYNVTEDGKVHSALEQNSKWILLSVQHEYKLFLFRIEKNTFAKSVTTDHE